MQLSDRKYKMFFDTEGIRDAFVGLACERLELGQPDLEAVEVLTPVRDVEVWGRLLETVQDQCWRFRTQQEDGVLLACEVQSSAEYLILMRLVAYASVTLVSLDRTEHFSRRRPAPVPCLFLIYTGEAAWTPTPLDELMRGHVPVAGPLFPYIYMDVRHDDFSTWGLPRELDLMVRAERTNTAKEFLHSGYLTDVRTLRDPNTVKALVDFMRRTMQGWSRQSAQDKAILDALQLDWESVTTPEEWAMAAVEIRRGYVAVKEAGRQEGHQVGLQEGLQEGLLTGARQTKVDMLCEVLQPVAGQQFVDELRVWLEDEGLLARLETNSIIDLRIRYGADPDSLRQAVRDLLGKTWPAAGNAEEFGVSVRVNSVQQQTAPQDRFPRLGSCWGSFRGRPLRSQMQAAPSEPRLAVLGRDGPGAPVQLPGATMHNPKGMLNGAVDLWQGNSGCSVSRLGNQSLPRRSWPRRQWKSGAATLR